MATRIRRPEALKPELGPGIVDTTPAAKPRPIISTKIEPRPKLAASRMQAFMRRDDDWVEVRCLVNKCHTGIGVLHAGQVATISPEDFKVLDALDLVKRLEAPKRPDVAID